MHMEYALVAGHPYLLACLLWSACWWLWIAGAHDDERSMVLGAGLALFTALLIGAMWAADGPASRLDPIWIVVVDVAHAIGVIVGVAALFVRRRSAQRARALRAALVPPAAYVTASRRRPRRSSAR